MKQTQNTSIRKWPYPFLSGTTISNDSEFMSFKFFEKLMEFLNTDKKTIFGQGLGLEVTSSTFHFSDNPKSFSVFKGTSPKGQPSSFYNRLSDYFKEGLIDTLHAYGEFDNSSNFKRIHAERVANHLEKIGTKIASFSNHGGVENYQNIGQDEDYHCGDIKGHPAYHTDLWGEIGIKFAWTDSMIFHSFKDNHSSIKNRLRKIRNYLKKQKKIAYFQDKDPNIIKNISLNDGKSVIGFQRFRGTGGNAPNLSSFGYQVSQIPWSELYRNNDGIIIYQHLGILSRINRICKEATIEDIKNRPEMYLAPFRVLSREFYAGRLWVAGCSRFLMYLKMLNNVSVDHDQDGHYEILTEDKKFDETALQGLTIYIDPINFKGLFLNKKKLDIQYNGPDETDRYSITVPIKKLKEIW